MNFFKKSIIFIVCFVVFISSFCVSSFAQKAPNGGDYVFRQYWGKYWNVGENGTQIAISTFINTDNLVEGQYYNVAQGYLNPGDASGIVIRTDLQSSTGSVLFEAGKTYNYSFNGIIYANDVSKYNVVYIDWYFDYADNTYDDYHQITTSDCVLTPYNNYNNFRIDATFTPKKDIDRIWARVFFRLADCSFYGGYKDVDITIEEVTLTNGLLDMIWGGIQNLFYTVLNIDDLTDSILNAVSSIQNYLVITLPSVLSNIVNYTYSIVTTVTSTIANGVVSLVNGVGDIVDSLITGQFLTDIQNFFTNTFDLPNLDELAEAFDKFYLFDEELDDSINGDNAFNGGLSSFVDSLQEFFGENGLMPVGILAASSVLTMFITEVDILQPVLWFALFIGMFGFVLGTSWLVGQFLQNTPSSVYTPKSKYEYPKPIQDINSDYTIR